MSPRGDHADDMGANHVLDDEAIEAFFAGVPDPRWQQHDGLIALDRDIERALQTDAPPIGPTLVRVIRPAPGKVDAAPGAVVALPQPTRTGARTPAHRSGPRRRRRLLVGLAAGTLAAAGTLPVAAATHVLPEPAHRAVTRVLEAVTPFQFPERPGAVRPGPLPAPVLPRPGGATPSGQPEHHPQTAGARPETTSVTPRPGAPATPPSPPASAPRPEGTLVPTSPGSAVVGQTPAETVVPSSVAPPSKGRHGGGSAGRPAPSRGRADERAPAASPPAPSPSPDRGNRR